MQIANYITILSNNRYEEACHKTRWEWKWRCQGPRSKHDKYQQRWCPKRRRKKGEKQRGNYIVRIYAFLTFRCFSGKNNLSGL